MVEWGDMCGFVSWPKSKTAEIALVCQTLVQLDPAKHYFIKDSRNNITE